MYDRGSGPALVVIPGVQGRWEWMRPALDSLSRRCRTISYSLIGDIGSRERADGSAGFDAYLRQLDGVLERAGLSQAALCGVSYGGLIALRYAATRPERVTGLVLVSAPAPGWSPSARQMAYISRPWMSTPAFVTLGPFRVWPEINSALPDWISRVRFAVRHGIRILMAPMIPPLMAARVRLVQATDFSTDCERIKAATLIVTGEQHLDTVVPVNVTERYRTLIPSARYELMDRTGHIGMITQPERFADLVGNFLHAQHH